MSKNINIIFFSSILFVFLNDANNGNLEKDLSNSEWDNLQSVTAKFLLINMVLSFSHNTTYLYKYRPLLYELDSLRQFIGNQQALNIINQKGKKSNFEPSFPGIYSHKKYDLQTIESDYLIKDIQKAFESWGNSIFKNSIDYETFKQNILPHL